MLKSVIAKNGMGNKFMSLCCLANRNRFMGFFVLWWMNVLIVRGKSIWLIEELRYKQIFFSISMKTIQTFFDGRKIFENVLNTGWSFDVFVADIPSLIKKKSSLNPPANDQSYRHLNKRIKIHSELTIIIQIWKTLFMTWLPLSDNHDSKAAKKVGQKQKKNSGVLCCLFFFSLLFFSLYYSCADHMHMYSLIY